MEHRRSGYTFIELLLAVVIGLWVGLGVYKTLSSGVAVWQKISSYKTRIDVAIFFDKIAQDLRNNAPCGGEYFHGEGQTISFMRHDTVGLLVDRISLDGDIRNTFLYRVEYTYLPQEKEIKRNVYELGTNKLLNQRTVCDGVEEAVFYYYETLADDKTARLSEYKGVCPKMVVLEMVLKGSGGQSERILRMIAPPCAQ